MTATTDTVMSFLLDRLREDEAEAQATIDINAATSMSPARVLAQVAAMRTIVEVHDGVRCGDGYVGRPDLPCETLTSLASIYADHPDYREEWRAEA